jgi:hypothetical protein
MARRSPAKSHKDSQRPRRSAASPQNPNPGDEAAPGTLGTGEDICPQCRGSGKINGARCANCGCTGKVSEGIGGA